MPPIRSSRRGSPRSLTYTLLVPLLLVVGGVMAAFAGWALVQRERTMVAEARRETQAYGTALGLALDGAFRDPDHVGIPAIIERISRQASVYGVVVYDLDGRPLFGPGTLAASVELSTPQEVRGVLNSGASTEFERVQDGVDVYSVVRPIRGGDGAVVGAFEVLQPMSSVEEEAARTRARFVLNTAVLLGAVTVLLLALVRRSVSEPLLAFAQGVRELGRGRLDHRIDPRGTIRELGSVAEELNRMAEGLETARAELVRTAEERLALERQIRQSEKMGMVGQLAAGLAHEIGAPLNVIRGRADLIMSGSATSSEERRNLGIIVDQIDRIARIVRTLLDFARHGESCFEPVDLVPIADAVLELVSVELSREGVAACRVGVESAPVLGDRDQLQQVILNLVLNASQALSDFDGERRIAVAIGFEGTEGSREVVVEVRDSGPGVPAEYRDRIFDPFFTTKLDRAGTGLGLAVARWIAEDHRGRLSLVSGEGPGTTLALRFPAYRPRMPREASATARGLSVRSPTDG